jgi:hypothetical protein
VLRESGDELLRIAGRLEASPVALREAGAELPHRCSDLSVIGWRRKIHVSSV